MIVLSTNFTADDIRVDAFRIAAAEATFGKLLEHLIQDPPDIQITPDQSWMDMSAYASQWEELTRSLTDLGQKLNDPRLALHNIKDFIST